MNVNLKTISKITSCLLVVSVLAISTGCRTGMFKKPDMSGLAFWKKGKADTTLPPPPARHFDPSPIDGMEEAIASSNNSLDVNQSEFAKRIDSRLNEARDSFAKKTSPPIRQPYSSLDEVDAYSLASKTSSFADGFNAAKKNVTSPANEFTANSANGLSQAQQDFKSAIGNATASAKNGLASATSPVKKADAGWKDFKLPTELSQAKNSIDKSLQSVQKSLYDASGKLNSGVASKTKSSSNDFAATNAFANATTEVKNTFDTNVAKASKTTTEAVNDFKAKLPQGTLAQDNSFSAAAQSNLGGFKLPTQPTTKQAFQNTGQSLADSGKAISEKANNLMLPLAKSFELPKASTQPISQANQELQSVQNQVAEAKQQIALLKQQVAEAQRLASTQQPPQARIAQLQVPPFNSRSGISAPMSTNPPMNILRAKTPLGQGSNQPATTSQPNQNLDFQSTPHGGFSPRASTGKGTPNFSPTSTADSKQVGFAGSTTTSVGSKDPNVFQATNSAIPPSQYKQGGVTNAAFDVLSTVSDVDIPASILQGKGSYAPGSVNKLISK